MIETVGWLTLANINPQASEAEGAPLEEIYVDLPTECVLFAEVKAGRVTEWWVARGDLGVSRVIDFPVDDRQEDRSLSQTLKCDDEEGLQVLIDQAEQGYQERRAGVIEAKKKGERHYRDIVDGVYTVSALPAGYIVDACRRLVVLGAPGSGKSTLVRHLALCLAGEEQKSWNRKAAISRLSGWTHGPLTPVYIELRRFVGSSYFPTALETLPGVDPLWNYIRAEILGDTLAAYAPQLEADLREGRALLVLDGLDEVPYPDGVGSLAKRQKQLQNLARAIDLHYGASRVVVASRPYAYENWQLDGYTPLRIVPLGDSERIALAANLFRVSHYANPDDKAERLNTALQQQGVSSELADTPLFLTLMATIFAHGVSGDALPARKGAMYHESVLLLLERWTRTKSGRPTLTQLLGSSTSEDLLARLARLAYKVHAQYGADRERDTPEIPEELLLTELAKLEIVDKKVKVSELLSYLSENTGLLVSPGHKGDEYVFRFAHRTFQEFLAARHLVESVCKDTFAPVREHIARQPDLWRTPCLLTGDVVRDTGHESEAFDRLWRLVDALLDGDPSDASLPPDDPHWWPVWLAAAIAQEQQLYERTPLSRGDRAVRDALVRWLVKLIETPGALKPPERAHCGRALALLGDPRDGVGTVSCHGVTLPDIAWVAVPDDGAWTYQDEQLSGFHTFHISRYPVTYAQFQTFLEDPEGYINSDRWFEGLAADVEDRQMRAQRFLYGNHPREQVNWYQAVAFCRWFSWRLGGVYDLDRISEWAVRLPTEQEWEKAARGRDSRVYPYGDEFDTAKGNSWKTRIGQTSAVGLFPDGASPYGVLDMSGNVWEWCMTAYDASGDAARVVRGGAWDDNVYGAGACARINFYFGNARYRDLVVGFRVVCLSCCDKRC